MTRSFLFERLLLLLIDYLSGVLAHHSALTFNTSLIWYLDRYDTLDVQYYIQIEVVYLNGRAASIIKIHRRLLGLYWHLVRQLLGLRIS